MTAKKGGTRQKKVSPTTQLFPSEIVVSLCGVGDMLNARFTVDEKMRQPGPIYLQDEKTGKICRMAVTPKIGPLMSSRRKAGNSAFCFFQNPDFAVKPGSTVTFVMGNYRKEHITAII